MAADEVHKALLDYLRWHKQGNVIVSNIFVSGYPWEADVVAVTPIGYWSEYEIKTSVGDYSRDFHKEDYGVNKHSVLAADGHAESLWGKPIPRPKHFWFVVPKGLLGNVSVPKHCGIMECDDTSYPKITIARAAPRLRRPTKLSYNQLFKLAAKMSGRILWE